MNDTVDKNQLDTVRIWNAYLFFNGDVDRTAATLELSPVVVRTLAESENWAAKLKALTPSTKGDPRDLAKQINRAVIFGHANKLRNTIGGLIEKISSDPGELDSYLSVPTKNGFMKSFKPLLDLAKALESTSILTQRALGDLDTKATDKKPEDVGSITAATLEALAHAAGASTDLIKGALSETTSPTPDKEG